MSYREMYEAVCEALREVDGDATKGVRYPFRRRSEHILRVFCWARRLIDEGAYGEAIDRRAGRDDCGVGRRTLGSGHVGQNGRTADENGETGDER